MVRPVPKSSRLALARLGRTIGRTGLYHALDMVPSPRFPTGINGPDRRPPKIVFPEDHIRKLFINRNPAAKYYPVKMYSPVSKHRSENYNLGYHISDSFLEFCHRKRPGLIELVADYTKKFETNPNLCLSKDDSEITQSMEEAESAFYESSAEWREILEDYQEASQESVSVNGFNQILSSDAHNLDSKAQEKLDEKVKLFKISLENSESDVHLFSEIQASYNEHKARKERSS